MALVKMFVHLHVFPQCKVLAFQRESRRVSPLQQDRGEELPPALDRVAELVLLFPEVLLQYTDVVLV